VTSFCVLTMGRPVRIGTKMAGEPRRWAAGWVCLWNRRSVFTGRQMQQGWGFRRFPNIEKQLNCSSRPVTNAVRDQGPEDVAKCRGSEGITDGWHAASVWPILEIYYRHDTSSFCPLWFERPAAVGGVTPRLQACWQSTSQPNKTPGLIGPAIFSPLNGFWLDRFFPAVPSVLVVCPPFQ